MVEVGSWGGARPGASPTPPAPPTPAAPPAAPGAPTGLAPDGAAVTGASVALSCAAVPSAGSYEFALEYLNGSGAWATYYTWAPARAGQTFYPTLHQTTYRFRVRAKVAGALGPWSGWAQFRLD